MKSTVVPVRLTPRLVSKIDEDVNAGRFDNRSDAVRFALRTYYNCEEGSG